MKVIVPIAGLDFERPDGSMKAELYVNGKPLLRQALESRPWWISKQARESDLVFVLRDSVRSRRFIADTLSRWYPAAQTVTISAATGGAALSAVAGIALVGHNDEPLCVDLVDILFRSTLDPVSIFHTYSTVGGIAMVFRSSNPIYSYLRTDENGEVIEAAEKRVISENASAGTYLFSSPAMYLDALAHSLRYHRAVTFNGLFFVCPLFNGVLASGKRVLLKEVYDVCAIEKEDTTRGRSWLGETGWHAT